MSTTIWIPHKAGLPYFEQFPAGVAVEVADDPDHLPAGADTVEFWVPTFLDQAPLRHLVGELPALKVIQLPSSGSDAWTGIVPPSITLCDARGVHDAAVAEWVVGAILASVRQFPAFQRAQSRHEWAHAPTGELRGRRVVIVGAGNIGAAVARRLEAFEVDLTLVARTARPGVHAVSELPGLLPHADIVVLLVPLTEDTRVLAGPGFLGSMPDGSLLVNAARGPVVDTAVLTAELTSGRLNAALDVTDPEPLPAGHPLWDLPNVLLTPHVGAITDGMRGRVYELAAAQARRFLNGEPLRNQAR